MEASLNLYCPACGAPIVPRFGCCSCCLTRAVQLQAARFGTELMCGECGAQHVVLRTDASRWQPMTNGDGPRHSGGDDWQVESFGEPDERSS